MRNRIRADYSFSSDRVEIRYLYKSDSGAESIAEPITLAPYKYGEWTDPMITLTRDEARELMDSLWQAGVRPTEQGSPGQIAALERHLSDMRAIAFGYVRHKE